MKRTPLIFVCAALVFGACGGGSAADCPPGDDCGPVGGAPSADPDDPVTSAPQSPGDGTIPSPVPSLATPQPGQADVRPIGWEKAEPSKDGRSVTISYWSGVEPCYVLDHVEVEYSATKVTITLFEGHSPSDEDTACIELAVYKGTVVELDDPLDDRKIIDGAPR